MCPHRGGDINTKDCYDIERDENGDRFITFGYSLFLPRSIFDEYMIRVTTTGSGTENERPRLVSLNSCSDGISPIQYGYLRECEEGVDDIVEFESSYQFDLIPGLNGIYNFELCITPYQMNNPGGDVPTDLFNECLYDGHLNENGALCFSVSFEVCSGEKELQGDDDETINRNSQKFGDRKIEFKVFPNPANDQISVSSQSENESVIVFNTQGQIQASYTLDQAGDHVIDISELNPGVYFLSKGNGAKNQVTRLVKI